MNIGVPQGSVLGVLMFLIYINDLPRASDLFCSMYADDSTFLCSGKNTSTVEAKVNNELIKVLEWFHANKMTVNTSKSRFMVFSPGLKKSADMNIFTSDADGKKHTILQIPNTTEKSFKLLGVHIDENLN